MDLISPTFSVTVESEKVVEPQVDAQPVRREPFLVRQQPDIRRQGGQAVSR